MQYFLLVLVAVFLSLQQIIQKQYNIKEKSPDAFLFSALTSITATVFFAAASGFRLSFTAALLPYSAGFAIAYGAACVGLVLSLKYGSLAISSLVISYSLLIPAMYGVIFLKEPLSAFGYVGIFLLLISLFLLNAKKEKFDFSWKWLVFIVIAFIGNGMCSTIQKMQQLKFDGSCKNEFMIIALIFAAVILFAAALAQGGGKRSLPFKYAVPNGICNGVVNLLVMILTGLIPNAILFPSISAGGIALSCITAIFIFKEKLTKIQAIGYITGILSVVLLNL